MKRKILFALIILISIGSYSQSKKTKNLLKEIEREWKLDDNKNLTYQRIVEAENLTKDEIFSRALNFFIYNYGSGKSVIQTQDKNQGRLMAKGLFNVHKGKTFTAVLDIATWHIIRVDVKEGRARILLTLSEYEIDDISSNKPSSVPNTENIINYYPINPEGKNKNLMGVAFYKTHKKAISTLDEIEKSILEGSTSKDLESNDW